MKNVKPYLNLALLLFLFFSTFQTVQAQCSPEIEYDYIRTCKGPDDIRNRMSLSTVEISKGYCLDDEVAFWVPNGGAGSSYAWEVTSATGTENYEDSPVNIVFDEVGVVKVCVTMTTSSGCEDTKCETFEISPPPTATFEAIGFPGEISISTCKGNTLFFLDNGSSSNSSQFYLESWNWQVRKGGVNLLSSSTSNATTPFSYPFNEAGTYEVILTVKNCYGCSDTYSITVEVDEAEACEIICPSVICEGDEVEYTADCNCSGYYWTFSIDGEVLQELEGNPVSFAWSSLPAEHSGYGLVTLTTEGCSPEGCSEPSFFVIPILPTEGQIVGPEVICGSGVYQYNLPHWPGAFYTWTIQGNPAVAILQGFQNSALLTVNSAFTGNFTIEVEVDHGFAMCGFETSIEVNSFDYEISGETEYCFGSEVVLSIDPAPPTDGSVIWYVFDEENNLITTCNPSGAELICADLPAGSYQVFYGIESGAGTFDCFENPFLFTVNPPVTPVADVEVIGEREICTGTPYDYSIFNTVSNSVIEWVATGGSPSMSMGDATSIIWTAGAPVHQLEVTRILGECRSETLIIPISVQAEPVVTIEGDDTACRDSRHIYQAMADGVPLLDAEFYNWSVSPQFRGSIVNGFGTPEIEVEWHPGTNTTVTVKLTVGVCGVSYTTEHEVMIIENPEIVFTVPQEVCVDNQFSMTAEYDDSPLDIADATISWTLETGEVIGTQPIVNYVFEEEGSHLVKFTITDIENCPGEYTFFHTINVLPNPKPFITTPDNIECPDCEDPGYATTITLYTQNAVGYNYQWEYRSIGGSWTNVGTNSPVLTVNIDNSLPVTGFGDYRVRIEYENCENISDYLTIGCACETCDQNPPVTLDFDWSFDEECAVVDLVGSITPFDPSLYQMFWNIQKSPDIEVIVTNASSGTYTLSGSQIPVNNPADLVQSLAFNVPGFYPVSLNLVEIGESCGPAHSEIIEIPVWADFRQFVECGTNEGTLTFTFTDQSEVLPVDGPGNTPINYSTSWELLEGTTVIDQGAGSEFTTDLEEGHTYSICLNVLTDYTNNGALSEPYSCQYCETIEIPEIDLDFTIDPQPSCLGNPIDFTPIVNADDVVDYHWEIFLPTLPGFAYIESFIAEPTFTFLLDGWQVSLTVTTAFGCKKTVVKTIESVNNSPTGNLVGVNNFCNTESTICYFPASGNPIVLYEWSTGESGPDLDCITVTETGNYSLTITDNSGCSASLDESVFLPPLAVSVIGNTDLCYGEDEEIKLTTNVVSGYTYAWTAEPALNNQSGSPYLFFSTDFESNTTYLITLSISKSGDLCLSKTIEVTIHPSPDFTLDISYDCGPPYNAIVEALDGSGDPVVVDWYEEGSFIQNGTSLQTIFGGTYTAELSNDAGCVTSLEAEVEGQTNFNSLLFGCYDACLEELDGSICIPGIPGEFTEWEWMYLVDDVPTSFDPPVSDIGIVFPLCLTEDLVPGEGDVSLEVVLRIVGRNGCEDVSEPICFDFENCELDCDITINSSPWCGNVCLDYSEYADISVTMRGPECGPGYARFTVLTPGNFYNLTTGNTAVSVTRDFILMGTSTFPTLSYWYRAAIFLPFNDLNGLEDNCFLVELFDEEGSLFYSEERCFDIECPRGEGRGAYSYSECVDLPPDPARDQIVIKTTSDAGEAWISYPSGDPGNETCPYVNVKIYDEECCREEGEETGNPIRELCLEVSKNPFYINLNEWHATCAEITVYEISSVTDENNIIRLAEGCFSRNDLDSTKKLLTNSQSSKANTVYSEPLVFPNPNTGQFSLSTSIEETVKGFKIYNTNMKEVHVVDNLNSPEKSKFEMDLEFLPGGIYFISIQYSDSTYRLLKFVKL